MTWGNVPLPDIAYFPIQNPIPDCNYKTIDLQLDKNLSIVGMVGIHREVLDGEYELRGNGTSTIRIYFPNLEFQIGYGIWIVFNPQPEIFPKLTKVTISNKTISWSYDFTHAQVDLLNHVYLCP